MGAFGWVFDTTIFIITSPNFRHTGHLLEVSEGFGWGGESVFEL